MEKNYRYAIRKTTLGVGSVAIAAFLAGQGQEVQAAEQPTQPSSALAVDAVAYSDEGATETHTVDSSQPKSETADTALAVSPAHSAETLAVPYAAEGDVVNYAAPGEAGSEVVESSTLPNYDQDEKQIQSYSPNERYRQTQMEQGAGVTATLKEQKDALEGFGHLVLNPGVNKETDPRKYGIDLIIDREKSQRTYTQGYITDSKNGVPVRAPQTVTAEAVGPNGVLGDQITYQPDATASIGRSGPQRSFNVSLEEADLTHINHINNPYTRMSWQSSYTRDNRDLSKQFLTTNDNFATSFSVNPYPNENDMLSTMRIEGNTVSPNPIVVKGQRIDYTEAKISNLDDSAKNRIIGQVYTPDGVLVPEAQAIVNADGTVSVQLPAGAVDDPNSPFNGYLKGVTQLKARFFARPRTLAELQAVSPDGIVTDTGAGKRTINHGGQNIEIPLQGIDRYDHYNLIGEVTLNLDDTRYRDPKFEGANQGKELKEIDEAEVINTLQPSVPFTVKLTSNDDYAGWLKNGNLKREIKTESIEKLNQGKAEKDQWKYELTNNGDLVVTPPASAKPGDTVAIPVKYTFSNGSTDVQWFHFVVRESFNNIPEYKAEAGFQGDTLSRLPEVPKVANKNRPEKYTLGSGPYIDSAGNEWTDVTIDEKTGKVTATVPVNANIIGGENIYIPVVAHYTDDKTGEKLEETVTAQFIARPKYKTTVTDTDDKLIPFTSKEEFDDTLPLGTIQVVQEGKPGKERTIFEQDVINGQKGLIDPTTGEFTAGDQLFRKRTETIEEKQDRLVKVGVKPVEETVTIPRTVEVEVDPNMEPTAEPVVVEEGQDGVVTVKTTRDPQTGAVNITKTTTTPAQAKKVKVGTKTTGTVVDTDEIPFTYTVEFDPNFYTNYPDATENYKVVTPGQAGSNKKTWTIENSKVVGDPVVETVAPVNAVIKVGQKDYTGSFETVDKDPVPYETEYIVDNTLEPGKEVVENPGALGEKTTTTTHTIQNGQVTTSTPGQSVQSKAPVKRVVRIGARSNGSYQVTEPIPFQVEVKKDPSLKKGEYKIETPGKAGSQSKTLTIENSQVTATSEPTINEQATNAVVLVGDQDFTGEVSHDVTEKVPFPVKVIEDPSLEKGTYHVDQEGVPGSKTTTYTQAIKNGAADGAMTSAVTAETAPKEHIIRVGTKPLTGSTNVTTTNQKPFDVEIEYDNTKPAGTVEVVPNTGIPGEETQTTPVTAEDGTLTPGTTTTTETKAPVNKKIIVGTQGYNGEFSHEYTNVVPFETEVEVDPSLAPNEVVEVQKGQLGETTTKVSQSITNGVPGEKVLSDPVQTKAPVNRKIKLGAKTNGQHSHTEEIPFKYTVAYDPSIKAGEYKIEVPGTPGQRTTTWTIENSKIVGQAEVTEKAPVDAVIKVGNKDFEGSFTTVDKNPIPFQVEVKVDPSLAPGTEVVDQEGVLGEEETPTNHKIVNGQVTESTPGETKQTKAPVKKIVRVGAKTDGTYTHTEVIPFEVEVRKVKDLKKGESRVAQEGQPGEQTTTVTIENSQVVGTPRTTTSKQPVKHIIEVGDQDFTGEVSHNVTETLPFKVDIQEDQNLPLFEIQEVQKGENGSKTTKYSQAIKNGVADGQLKTEEIARTEPKPHIIKVGTKAPENAESRVKEVPAETEYVYDSTKDKGTVEKGAYTPGKVETKIKNVFNPQTGQIETTTEEVVTPAKQVIVVGTKDYTGEFKHTEQSLAPFKTEYKLDPSLKPGQEVVEQEGKLGLIERDVSQKYVNGTMADKVFGQTREVIAPENRIVRIGAKTNGSHTSTEEIPFDVKVEVDPSLPKGEYKVVTPGQPGTKETTVTIENSQIVGQPVSKVTKEPVTQVIKVGNQDFTGQVSHTERFEVPYKVEVRENPNLKAGETKLVQEGQPGSYDVTYTQAIKNGQADGDLGRTITNPVEPKAHIVEVGTKPVAGTETAINKEIPVEIEYVFDENLEKGQVETGQLTPGKTETRVVSKVVDGQVVNTEETVVTPAKQIVRVGSKDFTGEYKFSNTCPVPFPVEIRQNPDLAIGTTKTVQEGVPGSKTTDYTQAIKNGHAEGAPVSQDGAYTAPKAHIIEVGTKPVAGNTHEVNKDVPVETIFEYDPSLDKGKVETVQVVPGHVTTQIVNKVVDGKVVTEEVPVVTPAKHIVKVGTKDYTGSFTTVDKNPVPFEVEYKLDPSLETGKEVVDQEGVLGEEETPITHTIVNGQVTESKPGETVQIKAPVKKIVRIGAKTDGSYTHTEEIPFKVVVEVDPSLNKGEYKVEIPGQVGHKTTTVTVENSQVVGTPKVEVTKEPVSEVIKVGDKDFTGQVSHTEHFETAFKVIVRRNDALKPGQVKTVQEGVKGFYDVTFTQKIKNGQADGSLQADRHNEIAAVDHIIEVGPDCPICPVPEQPDQPGQDKPNPDKPNEDKPGNDTPGGHSSEDEKPGDKTPGGHTPGGEPDKPTPGGNTPGGGSPEDPSSNADKPGNPSSEDPQPNDKTPVQGTSDPDNPGGSSSNEGVPAKEKTDGNTPEDPKSGHDNPGDNVSTDKLPEGNTLTDPTKRVDGQATDLASSASLSPVSHKTSSKASAKPVQVASVLPQTGAIASVTGVGLSLLIAGLGCLGLDRKKKK
ncbi:G5 domain-containing protein [Aerococcus urinae]|uniref:G5 domain-containing protein n=1 Tax=Aerococcus urinae TaxID=1376 RepID=UPI002550AC3F|nr:G5 domain-containing protein [Aerococcus urinae]MDK6596868.1 G5 domain-containing protein [Aerococcus urinae]MDK7800717.1 G5 domain-containing protein [Aerococcus urinae]MDK8654804.1 G5 domain-containing protein [Aerococcus urinae]